MKSNKWYLTLAVLVLVLVGLLYAKEKLITEENVNVPASPSSSALSSKLPFANP